MSNLDISERQTGDVTILDISGDIIFGAGNVALRHLIRHLIGENKKKILLNLSDVRYVDSSGIGELISALIAVKRVDGQLKLLNISQRIRELLAITRLLTVFENFDNEADATDSYL